jgi:predicted O-methyltransferase YrrM
MSKPPPTYTVDWFTNNLPLWTQLFKSYNKRPVNFLEIGTYEGRSAIWALDNILQHPESKITCVDNWKTPGTFQRFKTNISSNPAFKGKVSIFKGPARDSLKHPTILQQQYDVIYIDADLHSASVMEHAVLAFPLLKPGGLLIFDDYTYSMQRDNRCPKQAIDAFINAYAEDIRVITARWQVVIQKRKHPRARKPCRSEFYTF